MKDRRSLRRYGPWIISVISLFVALTSSAVALKGKNSVDSGDIKPNAVHSNDIEKYGVTHSDVAPDTIENDQIAFQTIGRNNIEDGEITAEKLSKLFLAYGPLNSIGVGNEGNESDATCPVGSRMISGGGSASGTTAALTGSFPYAAIPGNNPKTWKAQAHLLQSATGPGFVEAFALCLNGG